ncbi:hypothetical protein ASB57_09185 [Bordetella sp. N]|nr:hypothetical protein ASB57_09185 [Bordetella sp. N]
MLMSYGPENYVGAVIAITGTLYFQGGHTTERRQAIAECFDAYKDLAGRNLKWLWREEAPSGPPCQPYNKASPLREMFNKLDEDDLLNFHYTSGIKRDDASMYTSFVNAPRGWKARKGEKLSVLRFSLPYLDIVEHPRRFQEMFVDFARLLDAEHGHGGFGFVLSSSKWDQDQPTEAFVARRVAGLDIGEPTFMASALTPDTFKTVGWLTAINERMVEAAGGINALRSELPPAWFAFYDYGNGIVIQAGNEPDIATKELDDKPPIYVLPNAALRSLRSPEQWLHIDNLSKDPPRLTGAAGDAWMQRFDVPDEALLDVKAKLLDWPKLTPAHTLDSAR